MVAAVRQTWADGAADTNCIILHKRASGRRNCAKRQELFCYWCQMSQNEEKTWLGLAKFFWALGGKSRFALFRKGDLGVISPSISPLIPIYRWQPVAWNQQCGKHGRMERPILTASYCINERVAEETAPKGKNYSVMGVKWAGMKKQTWLGRAKCHEQTLH